MKISDYFRSKDKPSASIAKERLQIIVAHERRERNQPDFLPKLQEEILEVVRKYITVEQEDVEIHLDQEGSCSVLELNVTLPDSY